MGRSVKKSRRIRSVFSFIAAFIVVAVLFVAFASATTIETHEQLNEWMMRYYQHPQPDSTVSAVEFMSKDGTLSKTAAQPPIAAFLAQIFAQNPEKIRLWQTQLSAGSEDQLRIVALAFWMSGNESLLKAMAGGTSPSIAGYARKLLADRAPDLNKDEVNSAGFLDMLWGSFFATGEEKYVLRICRHPPVCEDGRRHSKNTHRGGGSMVSSC